MINPQKNLIIEFMNVAKKDFEFRARITKGFLDLQKAASKPYKDFVLI